MKFLVGSAKYVLVALVFSYFGSLLFAAAEFPKAYDWHHTVVSSLASPVEIPEASRVASYGEALSGVLLSALAFALRNALQPHAPKWTAWAQTVVVLGGNRLKLDARCVS